MTKTMGINELISKLKEYDGESAVKVWSDGANKAYPISHVFIGSINKEDLVYINIGDRINEKAPVYINIGDRNLVDLSKIWHDASEMPKKGTHILMEYGYLNSLGFKSYKTDNRLVNNWDTFKKYYRISRWAYIEDLLPKGGEK